MRFRSIRADWLPLALQGFQSADDRHAGCKSDEQRRHDCTASPKCQIRKDIEIKDFGKKVMQHFLSCFDVRYACINLPQLYQSVNDALHFRPTRTLDQYGITGFQMASNIPC